MDQSATYNLEVGEPHIGHASRSVNSSSPTIFFRKPVCNSEEFSYERKPRVIPDSFIP
jgi:hypothetical protein